MSNARWRERREAYLREGGRTADLRREGFIARGFEVIQGGGRRLQSPNSQLTLILGARASTEHLSGQEDSR